MLTAFVRQEKRRSCFSHFNSTLISFLLAFLFLVTVSCFFSLPFLSVGCTWILLVVVVKYEKQQSSYVVTSSLRETILRTTCHRYLFVLTAFIVNTLILIISWGNRKTNNQDFLDRPSFYFKQSYCQSKTMKNHLFTRVTPSSWQPSSQSCCLHHRVFTVIGNHL